MAFYDITIFSIFTSANKKHAKPQDVVCPPKTSHVTHRGFQHIRWESAAARLRKKRLAFVSFF